MSGAAFEVRGVVFDLDGTLVDSRRDIAEAANHALVRGGHAPLPHAELDSFVGDGAALLIARAARLEAKDERVTQMVAIFLDYYAEHPLDHSELMPGAELALRALAHYRLGICTNKPRRTTLAVLDGLELTTRFAGIVAGDDLPERKPDPGMVREAARRIGVPVTEVVMVGDGPQDILAGRAAGAFTVGVRGGIQAFERLAAAKPDLIIETLAELPDVIRELVASKRRR